MSNSDELPIYGPGAEAVSKNGIIGLGIYLLIVVILLFCSLCLAWPRCAVDANSNAQEPQETKVESPDEALTEEGDAVPSNGGRPKVISLSPASGQVNAHPQVTVRGSGFQKGSRVNFGGIPGDVVGPVTEDTITVVAPSHHPAKVDVTVINPNGNSDSLLASFQFTCPPISDTHLLLLVILAGALGGTIHAMRSLYWYVGNRDLCLSWVPMYVILPFSGAAIAFVFFLIIRGGFLTTTPDRETSVAIIAVAALAGMFSQQAALKLQDIANAFLTTPTPGLNSRPQAATAPAPAVKPATIEPVSGGHAGGTVVRILGTGFSTAKSISFGGANATGVKFDSSSSSIVATSPAHPAGVVDVIVTDNAGKTHSLKFRYE